MKILEKDIERLGKIVNEVFSDEIQNKKLNDKAIEKVILRSEELRKLLSKIFSTSINFGLKRFTRKPSLVNAEPIQYLLNPWGNTRNWRNISNTGE